MKKLIYLFLSLFVILLTLNACSDSSTGGSSDEPTLEKVADMLNMQQGAGLVYRDALQETGDTLAALEAMGMWIGANPAVERAWYHDLESIRIHYNNGLKSSIHIVPTDENGVHLTRGGGSTNGLKDFNFKTPQNSGSLQEIKNKKVLVLIPYTVEFEYSPTRIAELRKSFGSDFQVDVITDTDVGLDDINNMDDYGLIILDTHGQKHGFYMGKLERTFVEQDPWLVDDWTPENTQRELLEPYNISVEKIESGEIEITQNINRRNKLDLIDGEIVEFEVEIFSISVLVTENYIRNANIDLTDAIVFGNHCYSGHTADGPNKKNMAEAWRSKGVAAYYGYAFENGVSIPVDNKFALAMEKALIKRLVEDTDTTGVAHLKDDGARYFWDSNKQTFRDGRPVELTVLTEVEQPAPSKPFFFNHYFDMDYSYDACGTLIDARDGEEYELACIGDQTWMAENLRYLPFVHSNEEFEEAGENSQPGYGVYGYEGNNVSAAKTEHNYATYGALYNWWASMAGQASTNSNPSGIQGICPDGWHLPSKEEWDELNDFLGGQNAAGGKLKEAGTDHWNSPNTGATNETGFTALPGGSYDLKGRFIFLNEVGFFWSASDTSTGSGSNGRVNLLKHNDAISKIGIAGKGNGYSCRCVKDNEEE